MLHVAVHRDHGVTVRMVDAAGQRDLVPRIARKEDRLHVSIRRAEFQEDFPAAVAGAVVHKEKLVIIWERCHYAGDAVRKMRDVPLLVVNGNNNGNSFHDAVCASSPLLCGSFP
jgi:hypothetical protein